MDKIGISRCSNSFAASHPYHGIGFACCGNRDHREIMAQLVRSSQATAADEMPQLDPTTAVMIANMRHGITSTPGPRVNATLREWAQG